MGEEYPKKPFKLDKDGNVVIPNGPGLGIELDEDKLALQIVQDWKNPESYDSRDGSVVDW